MQRMRWSYQELMALPADYYTACIEMLNKDDRKQDAANERAKLRAKSGRR